MDIKHLFHRRSMKQNISVPLALSPHAAGSPPVVALHAYNQFFTTVILIFHYSTKPMVSADRNMLKPC